MSNSLRAKERRQKRSKMTKYQRDIMGSQHWGDKHTFHGRPIMHGQNKQELIEKRKKEIEDFQADFRERFGK